MANAARGRLLEAAIFDLDGVLTFTARIHEAAWKALFDGFLRARSARTGEPYHAFESSDYRTYVDGRPRYDGVMAFLRARGIDLPMGDPTDPPDRETVYGLGNRKDVLFRARLAEEGVEVDEQAVRLVQELRGAGVRVGVATSSRNAQLVLGRAGLEASFDAVTDGVTSERLGLAGKPEPDLFVACLAALGRADPERAVVVEDAVSGVQAARAGGFGLVLAVDRTGAGAALEESGADLVVKDFRGLTVGELERRLGRRFR